MEYTTTQIIAASIALAVFLIDWVIRLVLLFYVPRGRKPTAAMAWLLAIFVVPGLGILLFLTIGSTKLSKKRRAQQRTINRIIESLARPDTDALNELPRYLRERYKPLIELVQSLGKLPVRAGNQHQILSQYDETLGDIVTEIEKAKRYIYIEYYIMALDVATEPVFDALERAVERGVKVYALFDAYGSRKYKRRREMKQRLTESGIAWRPVLPLRLRIGQYNRPDLRNHRKIVAIDDAVAYIGSQNLIDKTYGRRDSIYYQELVIKMRGPIAQQCAAVFAGDWYSETGDRLHEFMHLDETPSRQIAAKNQGSLGHLLPSSSGYTYENNMLLFVALMHRAQHEITITNPYFVPNESLLTAVIAAARRGVTVTIINSEAMDQWMVGHAQRSYYRELLQAGVHIWLYKAPELLHSKHITIDDDVAVIGSSNMDIRSFELNSECVAIFYGQAVVNDLRRIQQTNLSLARQVSLKEWEKRSVWQELLDNIARLTASLQ